VVSGAHCIGKLFIQSCFSSECTVGGASLSQVRPVCRSRLFPCPSLHTSAVQLQTKQEAEAAAAIAAEAAAASQAALEAQQAEVEQARCEAWLRRKTDHGSVVSFFHNSSQYALQRGRRAPLRSGCVLFALSLSMSRLFVCVPICRSKLAAAVAEATAPAQAEREQLQQQHDNLQVSRLHCKLQCC
jgi:hypothetical protein